MNGFKIVTALLLALVMIGSLGACAIKVEPARSMSSADEAEALGFAKENSAEKVAVGEYVFLNVDIRDDYRNELSWSSSDNNIARVDANGRVDGIKTGNVVITAKVMDLSLDYKITVTKAKKSKLNDTTATLGSASALATAQSNINSDSGLSPYALLIDVQKNVVVAYTYNASEKYTIAVRKMACATEASEKLLTTDNYYSGTKERWYQDTDGYYYQYSTQISDDFRFSSAPYKEQSSASLLVDSFNKIGTNCTDGDIWLSVSDAKWIYDNCGEGTQIRAYNGTSTPLNKPELLKLSGESAKKGWDPTDPSGKNPFKNAVPTFSGVDDVTIQMGDIFDPRENVEVYDSFGNKMKKELKIDGTVYSSKAGSYVISYYYTDTFDRTGRADRIVTVE